MKRLFKNFAFWILDIQKINTFNYIEHRLSRLANDKFYSIQVDKSVHVDGSSNISYRLYIGDEFGGMSATENNLERAFEVLGEKLNHKTKIQNEIHI